MSTNKQTNFWDFAREHGEGICTMITISVIVLSIAAYHITKTFYKVNP